jgi:glycerol-3-phosphate acyltransferase PlsY
MNPWYAVTFAVAGYLVGSVSFARIMFRLVAPEQRFETIRREVPGTDDHFEADSVSATGVRIQLGTRYGCLTSLLDAAKAAIPLLALRAWQPDQPYYLIAATTATVGHIYPLYYGFRGGRGLSVVYGGLTALDPLGVIATTVAGMVGGILTEQILLLRWAGLVLMIAWTWFRSHDVAQLAYVIAANILFWTAMLPELRQAVQIQGSGTMPDSSEVADLMGMGSFWAKARRYSIRNLLGRLRRGGPQ